ncbi:MAG TPA: glucosaminidase domain-containing protein [Thermoleophilia bacterium]|nr:glucosaminidase domain-containing protein [Thermoleophilia bacterium]
MKHPSTRSIAVIIGAALVVAGSALALAAVYVADPAPLAAPSGVAIDLATNHPATSHPTPADPSAESPSRLAATPQEPPWRSKQREVERSLLRAEGHTDSVGAVALIAFDPALQPTAAPGARSAASSTPTRTVLDGGATPLRGVWAGTAAELSRYLLVSVPSPRFTVPASTLAGYYVHLAAEVGLRADILWAQMLHETGFGSYTGSVRPEQNNFAGIGATGNGAPGLAFPTAEAGVQAHVAHMVAYVFLADQAAWTNSSTDPRYDSVSPRGAARTLSDLDGRWAVPGVGYSVAIERHVRAINAR